LLIKILRSVKIRITKSPNIFVMVN